MKVATKIVIEENMGGLCLMFQNLFLLMKVATPVPLVVNTIVSSYVKVSEPFPSNEGRYCNERTPALGKIPNCFRTFSF
jgi:hypothetical protein